MCSSDLRAEAGGLVELVADAAVHNESLRIFGTDYPTTDGTCVRDYVHVDDVVAALRLAMQAAAQARSLTVNIGSGIGSSVRDVVHAIEDVSGRTVALAPSARRLGDIPVAVANIGRATELLDWRPTRSLADIAQSSWRAARESV